MILDMWISARHVDVTDKNIKACFYLISLTHSGHMEMKVFM